MTTIQLKADPAQLENAAGRMQGLADQYLSAYKKLYATIDTAHGAWRGADSDAFYQKAQELQDDFDRMYKLLMGAANDLRESSQKYAETQEAARSAAGSLASNF